MRGRLDSKGQRYGKLIDYKVSELRFVELLENLCEDVASGYASASGARVPSPRAPRAKAMRAELSGYCHRLVEEQEEALQAALYAGDLDLSTAEDVMCRQLAPKDCDGVHRLNETESRSRRRRRPPRRPRQGKGREGKREARSS